MISYMPLNSSMTALLYVSLSLTDSDSITLINHNSLKNIDMKALPNTLVKLEQIATVCQLLTYLMAMKMY